MEMTSKTVEFSAENNALKLLSEDKEIAILSIYLMHQDDTPDDHNRNWCNISHEAIEKSIDGMRGKPIVYRLTPNGSDVVEHARNDKEKKNMRVAGIIPFSSNFEFVKNEDNGLTYIVCDAIIYKKYCPQLMDILLSNGGEMKVSTEILANGHQDEDNGIFYIDEFVLEGVCLLGDGIEEGILGSHLKVLKFSKREVENANKKYLQFSQGEKPCKDIFEQIKNNKKENTILNGLTINSLQKQIWTELRKIKVDCSEYCCGYDKYWYVDLDEEKKVVIVEDSNTQEYFEIPYSISENNVLTLDEASKKQVVEIIKYQEIENSCDFLFDKDEYGKGEALKVDKSKEAMSDTEWGKINKTALRKDILDAENYKDLVHDVYLRVEEGWEDAPSQKLGYPVMEIKGDTVVYNRNGLASALGYAKANNEEEIVEKIEEIYDDLDIGEEVENAKVENAEIKVEEPEIAEVENKVDEDNKDLEKIKDDADAIEDDEKEELEKDNAEVDAPAEEGLKDDIESDKDYWKKKYEEKDNECKELQSKLAVYKLAEDKVDMKKYLDENKDAFDDDEYKIMTSKIENMDKEPYMEKEEFIKFVDDKFVCFLKDKYAKDKAHKANNEKSVEFVRMNDISADKHKTNEANYERVLSNDEILAKLN